MPERNAFSVFGLCCPRGAARDFLRWFGLGRGGLPAAAAASGVLATALLGVCGAARPARPGCPPPAGRRLLCTNASQAVLLIITSAFILATSASARASLSR